MEGKGDWSRSMIGANGVEEEEEEEEEEERSEKRTKPITSSDQMDVEAYANLYSGRTKLTRLLFIADRCNNRAMDLEALRMAHDEIRKGENTQLYREVAAKIDGRLGPAYFLDQAWVNSIDRRAEQRREKLENELSNYRFLETGLELGNNYTEVIALQDVATYGGLCVLACFDRTELKNKVIDNINFRNFLELVPELRELIHDFYASRYASCLEYLEKS